MEANVLNGTVKAQYWQLMPTDFTAEFRHRMAFAFEKWRQRERRFPEDPPSQTELGRRVAVRIRRGDAYTQSAVAGWLDGNMPRELEAADALATELKQEPNWLYFARGEAPAGFAEMRAQLIAHDRPAERGKVQKRKRA